MSDREWNSIVQKRPVEGGWLYRVDGNVVFVPSPERWIDGLISSLEGEKAQRLVDAALKNKAIFEALMNKVKEAVELAFQIVAEEQENKDSLDEM